MIDFVRNAYGKSRDPDGKNHAILSPGPMAACLAPPKTHMQTEFKLELIANAVEKVIKLEHSVLSITNQAAKSLSWSGS